MSEVADNERGSSVVESERERESEQGQWHERTKAIEGFLLLGHLIGMKWPIVKNNIR